MAGKKRPPKKRLLATVPKFFAAAADLGKWLEKNSATTEELIVGFHKVSSGKPSMLWPESVDEALRYGWIDGVRKRIDDNAYHIRFSPRKPSSIWSAVNIAKVKRLTSQGRMTESGLAAFARRTANRSVVYAYEQRQESELSVAEIAEFKRDPQAWEFFRGTPPSYRKILVHWIARAIKPQTRDSRFRKLLEACTAGERLR
ncbi:MAG: YdeI/OmpD-associated family protein [Steroidobacteraceae bacterium]|jgi:uncharacterized protein YdeI (YjbR/CyaY-like superfamily)